MKEIYFNNENFPIPIILKKGTYKTFNFVIVSYGTHPCCYVELPARHPYFKKDYDDMKIECHGGLTYSNYRCFDNSLKYKYYIGWDYHHLGDYWCLPFKSLNDIPKNEMILKDIFSSNVGAKKWTIKEMFAEVIKVIEQLINIQG